MKKYLAVILLAFIVQFSQAQSLRVYFSDKGEVQANHQNVALSPKALENRSMRNIPLDERDLPVKTEYLSKLDEMGGEISMKSRWFNYALVKGLDAETLEALPFVKKVEEVKKYKLQIAGASLNSTVSTLPYGKSANQIEMVNGHKLHDLGYQGQGMTIAVIDAGFRFADTARAYDSLWINNRILGSYNFRSNSTNVFSGGTHGASVLSILGAYIENEIIGSAPKASYWLLQSEYEPTETPIEMDHWLEAAEFADSVGADIITSSLGYSTFDDPDDSFTYADMDGNTTLVTRAADMAAAKGLLVVVSAGNEGNSPWQYITAPADGDSVLAIGAVNAAGQLASFSSIGPSADGRIKPDLVAQGEGTAYAYINMAFFGNGTSFSCPVVSGLAACLWQVDPSRSNMHVFNTLIKSANQYFAPDNYYGFGIPNFEHAAYTLSIAEEGNEKFEIYPVPVRENLNLKWENSISGNVEINVLDVSGRIVKQYSVIGSEGGAVINLPPDNGMYILQMKIEGQMHSYKIVK